MFLCSAALTGLTQIDTFFSVLFFRHFDSLYGQRGPNQVCISLHISSRTHERRGTHNNSNTCCKSRQTVQGRQRHGTKRAQNTFCTSHQAIQRQTRGMVRNEVQFPRAVYAFAQLSQIVETRLTVTLTLILTPTPWEISRNQQLVWAFSLSARVRRVVGRALSSRLYPKSSRALGLVIS